MKCELIVSKKNCDRNAKHINLTDEIFSCMHPVINVKIEQKTEHLKKLEAIRSYYELVKKGRSPEQTRKDLGLTFQDIEDFDFSVFNKAV